MFLLISVLLLSPLSLPRDTSRLLEREIKQPAPIHHYHLNVFLSFGRNTPLISGCIFSQDSSSGVDSSPVFGRKASLKRFQPSDSALHSALRGKHGEVSNDAALSLGQGLNFKDPSANRMPTLPRCGRP